MAVFALLSMFYNGRAQDVKVEKTDTLGNGQVRKTIKVEIKERRGFTKFGKKLSADNVQIVNKSAVNQPKVQVRKVSPEDRPMESNNGKQLWAKSYLNRAAPQLKVEKWLTEVPDTEGKFVLIDFWGPSCSPCRKSIPDFEPLQQAVQG